MPKSRKPKRKTPVTTVTSSPGPSDPHASHTSNPHATRTTIRRFHVLIKRQAQLQHTIQHPQHPSDVTPATSELAHVQQQIHDLGGLAAYQRMSAIGQGKDRGGGSETVLIVWLRDMRLHETRNLTLAATQIQSNPTREEGENPSPVHTRLRLLEVGALKPDNYATCHAWLDVTPIDLHSQHPSILQQDFLLMDPDQNRQCWDIISLSLVLNFVPSPQDRGRMLRLAHSMLRPNGLLFVALPLPCVLNSRYLTPDHFQGLMSAIGFRQIHSRWKDGGKMAYWLFLRTEIAAFTSAVHDECIPFQKKTVFRQGDRNNFVILL